MPSPQKPALITAGPFLGLGATNQGPYETSGLAAACSAANPNRFPAALSAELGRSNLANLTLGGGQVTAIAPYIPNSTDEQIIATTVTGGVNALSLYDPATKTQTAINYGSSVDTVAFDQAVQFGGTAYLNSGRQYSALAPTKTYSWGYAAPNYLPQYTNPFATPVPPSDASFYFAFAATGSLPAGTYYYAFTWLVTDPSGSFTQETSELGADFNPNITNYYPYVASSTGAGNGVTLRATTTSPYPGFYGTFPDGSTYTTNVYRQSAAQPVWYFLTNLNASNTTMSGVYQTYTDSSTTDAIISANAQLVFRRDPPPIYGGNLPAICIHKERTWAFTIVNSATLTNGLPQCQLLYSNLGRPWEFDYVNNVLLVGNSATPNTPGTYQSTYGDEPVALCSLSSVLVALKTRTMWVIYGDDPTNFIARQVFSGIGTRARQSIATGPLGTSLVMFWLSEHGVFVFDGSTPLRIDEDVRSLIRTLPLYDRINAVGFYSNLTYYISFPQSGFTLGYFTNTAKWFYLPYATSFAFSVPANPPQYGQTSGINEVTAVRPGTNYVDSWFAGGELDLGQPQTVTWTTPITDSGQPQTGKEFTHIICSAPIQPGLLVTVSLYFDATGTPFTYTFDMGRTTRGICEVPAWPSQDRGFLNYMTISYNTLPYGAPIQIYGVAAYGDLGRTLVLPQ
jgi:hypothetical protein